MATAKKSKLAEVMNFFRTASPEMADEGLALARQIIADKKALATKVKEGQAAAARKREKEAAAKAASKTASKQASGKKHTNGSGGHKAAAPANRRQRAAVVDPDQRAVDTGGEPEGADPTM